MNPRVDPGFLPLEPPEYFWRANPRARIIGFSASQHAQINAKIDSFVAYAYRHKQFSKAVEFNTIPVVLENARFKKSFVTAGGRGLLSGAAGMRLQNRYLWANEDMDFDPESRLVDYFVQCQQEPGETLFRDYGDAESDLPFAVDCRNTFNYYHFLTESLCQISTLDKIGSTRPIFMHFPNQIEKTRSFTRSCIEALYPELQARVTFISADTFKDERAREVDGDPHYKVTLRVNREALTERQTGLEIKPGMLAEVELQTGGKTVLTYLTKPLYKSGEALREP